MTVQKLKVITTGIIEQADELAIQHVNFTEHYVTRANEELYKMLAGMLSVCVQVKDSAAIDKLIKQMRKTIREKYNIKTQANSRVSSIVVRYVVGASRKTAHVYGRVIEAAIADGITAENLPEYICNNGGIEAIRKSLVKVETKAKFEYNKASELINKHIARKLQDKAALGTIAFSDEKYKGIAGASDVTFTYLMCINDPSKNALEVVATLYPSSQLEQYALDVYQASLCAASTSGSNKFYAVCKEQGLNMDLVNRWMQANNFNTNKAVKEFGVAVNKAVKAEELLLLEKQDLKIAA